MEIHTISGRRRLGIGLSLCTALMWAVAPIALKVVLGGMDAYTISWYRFVISAALLAPIVLWKHGAPRLRGLGAGTLLLLMVAVLCLSVNYGFFLMGLDRLTPSSATVTIQTAPAFMLFGSVIFFKERYSRRQLLGFIVLVAGLALFFNHKLLDLATSLGTETVGIILVIAAALTWTAYALAQKQLLTVLPAETVLLAVYLGGVICFLPLARPATIVSLNGVELGLLIFCGLNTIIAYGAFSMALAHLEASRISAIFASIPLITIASVKLLVWISPGAVETETLNLISVAGALLVVGGSMVSSLSRR